jgi:hypothetical protein
MMLIIGTGALLEEVPKEGDAMKMQGSAMVCVASSKEEVIEQLKTDIYAKSDVWDFSKVSLAFGGIYVLLLMRSRSRFIRSSVLSGTREGHLRGTRRMNEGDEITCGEKAKLVCMKAVCSINHLLIFSGA